MNINKQNLESSESQDKVLVWFAGEVKTPPFSREARIEAGYLLRLLQKGELLSMPQSRPMPSIGKRCHELRINDESKTWRIIYRIEEDAIVIVDVFAKKTNKTPEAVLKRCQKRLKQYEGM
ncbi:type II toxin-antitoxin system RelE/ParE family toxin [Pleurocapsa sp. PCC 7319]|uniref:type II toxin-antitoxin system RelE/ParE family toxin n=1 Tax=Pleurocapsa sp. PCC 7319 TaxID=118161 RepID=UPI000344DEFD|nr:type II toxin-antitoxin system RelE/ParE family toxin [Pleurocapsa sp. PCC 7319]